MWKIWSNFGLKSQWFEMWRKHLNDGILLAQLEQFFDYFLLRIDYTFIPVSAPWQLLKTTTFPSRVECAYMSAVLCSLSLDQASYRPCNEKVVWETLRWMCWLNRLNLPVKLGVEKRKGWKFTAHSLVIRTIYSHRNWFSTRLSFVYGGRQWKWSSNSMFCGMMFSGRQLRLEKRIGIGNLRHWLDVSLPRWYCHCRSNKNCT
jgi:hypothetical protein